MTSSMSSTVATPSRTRQYASRRTAPCSRLKTNPSISRCTRIGRRPALAYSVAARSTTGPAVRSPATSSITGIRYGGLPGCAMRNRAATASSASAAMAVGNSAELELASTAESGAASAMRDSISLLMSSRSGTHSWTRATFFTATSRSSTKLSRSATVVGSSSILRRAASSPRARGAASGNASQMRI